MQAALVICVLEKGNIMLRTLVYTHKKVEVNTFPIYKNYR